MPQRVLAFGAVLVFVECSATLRVSVHHFDFVVEVVVLVQLEERAAVFRLEIRLVFLVEIAHEQLQVLRFGDVGTQRGFSDEFGAEVALWSVC